jgi:hypothetical protein
MADTMVDMHA